MSYTAIDRKDALYRARIASADIARELGVSEALVSLVIAGKRISGPQSRRVMARLAELLGVPVTVLFPGVERRQAV